LRKPWLARWGVVKDDQEQFLVVDHALAVRALAPTNLSVRRELPVEGAIFTTSPGSQICFERRRLEEIVGVAYRHFAIADAQKRSD